MANVSSLPSADVGYPFLQCPWAWILLLLTRLGSWVHAATFKLIWQQMLCVCSFCICYLEEIFGESVIWSAFSNVCAIILNKNERAKLVLKDFSVNCLPVYFILRNVADRCKFVFRLVKIAVWTSYLRAVALWRNCLGSMKTYQLECIMKIYSEKLHS